MATRKASAGLSIPDDFISAALALPDRIDRQLAKMTPKEKAANLRQAGAMLHYARDIRANVDVVNAIQYVNLKMKASIGADNPPSPGGRGKKTPVSPDGSLRENTIALYWT